MGNMMYGRMWRGCATGKLSQSSYVYSDDESMHA
jgi:hypothetical protein